MTPAVAEDSTGGCVKQFAVTELSMSTDYQTDCGNPGPYLQRIAAAGFAYVHWVHHWSSDFVYAAPEIRQIKAWFREYGLRMLDVHGSFGHEKCWASVLEHERLAGVELVRNRLELAAELEGDIVVMHVPAWTAGAEQGVTPWTQVLKSLDALEQPARKLGVRLAIENGEWGGLRRLLERYAPEYLGLCYDSGHGNCDGVGLAQLEGLKQRLIAVHLHDNDGGGDQHNLVFSGTVDWARLSRQIAESSYDRCVSLETLMGNSGIADEEEFLREAHARGLRLARMVDEQRALRR
jgi:sugar phosphate isomerase/epimerase